TPNTKINLPFTKGRNISSAFFKASSVWAKSITTLRSALLYTNSKRPFIFSACENPFCIISIEMSLQIVVAIVLKLLFQYLSLAELNGILADSAGVSAVKQVQSNADSISVR